MVSPSRVAGAVAVPSGAGVAARRTPCEAAWATSSRPGSNAGNITLPAKNGLGFDVSPNMKARYPDVEFSQFIGAEMMARKYDLTKAQARRIALAAQGFDEPRPVVNLTAMRLVTAPPVEPPREGDVAGAHVATTRGCTPDGMGGPCGMPSTMSTSWLMDTSSELPRFTGSGRTKSGPAMPARVTSTATAWTMRPTTAA